MTANSYRILIGARGWLHTRWQSNFYPEDLPDDWRLGYYSNEFPVALMPATYWQQGDDEIEAWLEDSSESLQLLAEIPADYLRLPEQEAVSAINGFLRRLSILGEHCLGVSLPLAEPVSALASLIEQLDRRRPLCLDVQADMPAAYAKLIQKICDQCRVGIIWHGHGAADCLAKGPLSVTRLAEPEISLRQLRTVVETILDQSRPEQTCVLIFDGNSPDLEAMRQANVILDLI